MEKNMDNSTYSNLDDKTKLIADGHLTREESALIKSEFERDKENLFEETRSGILKNLINKDYRRLSEKLIGREGIKEVQKVLFADIIKQTGNTSKYADGIFGPGTFRKLIDFQKTNGLVVDGIAGNDVLGKVRNFKEGKVVDNDKIVGNDTKDINIVDDNSNKKDLNEFDIFDKSKLTEIELKKIQIFKERFKKIKQYCTNILNNNELSIIKREKKVIKNVNLFVNNIITYTDDSDLEKGERVVTNWKTTKDIIKDLNGDCEDYVLLKKEILMSFGFDENKLTMVSGKTNKGTGHMLLYVNYSDNEDHIILDNRKNEFTFSDPKIIASNSYSIREYEKKNNKDGNVLDYFA